MIMVFLRAKPRLRPISHCKSCPHTPHQSSREGATVYKLCLTVRLPPPAWHSSGCVVMSVSSINYRGNGAGGRFINFPWQFSTPVPRMVPGTQKEPKIE